MRFDIKWMWAFHPCPWILKQEVFLTVFTVRLSTCRFSILTILPATSQFLVWGGCNYLPESVAFVVDFGNDGLLFCWFQYLVDILVDALLHCANMSTIIYFHLEHYFYVLLWKTELFRRCPLIFNNSVWIILYRKPSWSGL